MVNLRLGEQCHSSCDNRVLPSLLADLCYSIPQNIHTESETSQLPTKLGGGGLSFGIQQLTHQAYYPIQSTA
jgi:hypothetical protein